MKYTPVQVTHIETQILTAARAEFFSIYILKMQ
jgi:hypothetical protein